MSSLASDIRIGECQLDTDSIAVMQFQKPRLILLIALLYSVVLGVSGEGKTLIGCFSPQYLEVGTQGVIQCQFPSDFRAVYWFDDVTDENVQPTLTYKNSVKAGVGYDSGEFDIYPNGSLIIKTTSLLHEKTFKVICFGADDLYNLFHISVKTTVSPTQLYPQISHCDDLSRLCFIHKQKHDSLSCRFNASRPASLVAWFIQFGKELKIVNSSTYTTANEDSTFNTMSRVNLSVCEDYSIAMLYCGAKQSHIVDWKYKSVLVEFLQDYSLDLHHQDPRYYTTNALAKIQCLSKTSQQFNNMMVVIWKKHYFNDSIETIALWTKDIQQRSIFDNDYSLGADGSLIIKFVKLHHEGNYICVASDFVTETVNSFHLVATVLPSPPYVVLDKCPNLNKCTLESAEGTITCAVYNVRPRISLEWSTKDEKKVYFKKEETSVHETAGLFSVSSTLHFHLSSNIICGESVSVACSAHNLFNLQFPFVRVVELRNANCSMEDEDGANAHNRKWIAIVSIPLLLAVFIIVIAVVKKQRRRVQSLDEDNIKQGEPLLSQQKTKEEFIKELRTTYDEILSNSTLSPWISQFSEIPVNFYIPNNLRIGETKMSSSSSSPILSSYKELFDKNEIKDRHILIEGGPGLGKTYFITHLISEWLKAANESSLQTFDILIMLSLKEMNKSLFETIVEKLLADDTPFTPDQVQEIVRENRCLLLLDDFEQYPKREERDSEIHRLMSRNFLRNAKVIMMTRPTLFTKTLGKSVVFLSMESFTTDQINTYIHEFFKEDEDLENKVRIKLEGDINIASMCKTPLFLCMSAYIFFKNPQEKEIFQSITTFFEKLLLFLTQPFHKDSTTGKGDFDIAFHNRYKGIARVAIDGVRNSEFSWSEDYLSNNSDDQYIETLRKSGVLTETKNTVQGIAETSSEIVYYKFSHDLYQYFYGAMYIAYEESVKNLTNYLCSIDAYSCETLFVFICGLSKKESFVREVVQYLLDKEDYYPYPIRDCIIQCFYQVACNNWNERRDLLENFCKKEYSFLLRYYDSESLNKKKAQLIDICSKNSIPVNVLAFNNVLKEIHGKTVLMKTPPQRIQLPNVVECIFLMDFQGVCQEKDVMFLIENTAELEDVFILSTLQPSTSIVERSRDIISKNGINVLWITFEGEKVVTVSFPFVKRGIWATYAGFLTAMSLRYRMFQQQTELSEQDLYDKEQSILTTIKEKGFANFMQEDKEFSQSEAKDLISDVRNDMETIENMINEWYWVYEASNDESREEHCEIFKKHAAKLENRFKTLNTQSCVSPPSNVPEKKLKQTDGGTKEVNAQNSMHLLSSFLKGLLEMTKEF